MEWPEVNNKFKKMKSIRLKFRNLFNSVELICKLSLPSSKTESIYFFTFHKCASTLFSSYGLKNFSGLRHIDYSHYLWVKPKSYNKKLIFKRNGFVYGPIRLSTDDYQGRKLLILPTSDLEFVKDKKAIFFIRDPRDILVSAYYSFGFTHPLNPQEKKRDEQLVKRKKIQSLTLDEYVLVYAEQQIENFSLLGKVAENCSQKTILRYEDMVVDFDSFAKDLQTMVSIKPDVVKKLYNKSRPKKEIDNQSHRRSGETRRFEKELKPETVKELNRRLKNTLIAFSYEI